MNKMRDFEDGSFPNAENRKLRARKFKCWAHFLRHILWALFPVKSRQHDVTPAAPAERFARTAFCMQRMYLQRFKHTRKTSGLVSHLFSSEHDVLLPHCKCEGSGVGSAPMQWEAIR
eukprot:6086886-Amphidinium_carterae.1